MNNIESSITNSISKQLPKEYLIYKLRLSLNNDLYENEIISYEVFVKMQKFIIRKMNKFITNYNN